MLKLIYKKKNLDPIYLSVICVGGNTWCREKILKRGGGLPRCLVFRSSHHKVSVPPLYLPEPILLSSKIVISTYETQLRNIQESGQLFETKAAASAPTEQISVQWTVRWGRIRLWGLFQWGQSTAGLWEQRFSHSGPWCISQSSLKPGQKQTAQVSWPGNSQQRDTEVDVTFS